MCDSVVVILEGFKTRVLRKQSSYDDEPAAVGRGARETASEEEDGRKVRRDDEGVAEATFEQTLLDVLWTGVVGAAVRVSDARDVLLHEVRGGVSRVWFSGEIGVGVDVFARRSLTVCKWRERKGKDETLGDVGPRKISSAAEWGNGDD